MRTRATILLSLATLSITRHATGDLKESVLSGQLRVLSAQPGPAYIAATRTPSPGPDTLSGFEGELLEGFARLQGLKIQLVEVPSWEALVPALLERRGDLIAGNFTDTDRRRERITFTAQVCRLVWSWSRDARMTSCRGWNN